MVDLYNSTLRNTLNSLALEKYPSKQFSPWFTEELLSMKTHGHKRERLWRSAGLFVHLLVYKEYQACYLKALKAAHSTFYSDNDRGNHRTLFSTISRLLHPTDSGPPTATTEKCNRFSEFFKAKINTIRENIVSSNSKPTLTPPSFGP